MSGLPTCCTIVARTGLMPHDDRAKPPPFGIGRARRPEISRRYHRRRRGGASRPARCFRHAAIASPYSTLSMPPEGAPYAYRQDGFTFDAGPTIITAPWLFEQLWSACGGCLRDDVEIMQNDPFYKVRFDDGTVFSYSGDQAAMEAEIARISPEDVPGYRSFMKESRRIYEVAFLQFATQPFHSKSFTAKALGQACPPGRIPIGLCTRLAAFPAPQTAHALFLPSAAYRRQPVHGDIVLLPDRASGKQTRRPLCRRRHERAGERHSKAHQTKRRNDPTWRDGRDHPHLRAPGDRRTSRRRRKGRSRRRHFQLRPGNDLRQSC